MSLGRKHKIKARCDQSIKAAALRWRMWRAHLGALFNRRPGISTLRSGPEVIVSLTTIRSRLQQVHLAIECLLQQSFRPSRIILWVSDELTPADLPLPLRRQQRRGLEVRFRRDLRSFTKLIHALREHPDDIIVTADDDTFYPSDWLKGLHQSYLQQPRFVHCHRAHLMLEDAAGSLRPYLEWDFFSPGEIGPSLSLLPTGVGGVLYPPRVLPPEVFNEAIFLKLCPQADDVWFKAMALLAGVPTVKVAPDFREYPTVPGTQTHRLCSFNFADGNNDRQIRAVFEHYNLLPVSKLQPCFDATRPLFICGSQ